ncbi:MAG: hypothetical protein FVQ77_00160 [Cytophagales bacterium]|nr:hypothetical protein [Cytophagales bacterium]
MRKLIRCSIIILVWCQVFPPDTPVFAQADKTARENTDMIPLANDMYNFRHFKDAQDIYLKVLEFGPDNAAVNLLAGLCYLKTVNKVKAIPYLKKAHQLNPEILKLMVDYIEFSDEELARINSTDYIIYLIAKGYHLTHDFNKAIEYYERYHDSVLQRDFFKWGYRSSEKNELINKIKRNIFECNNGKEFVKYPVGALIDNIGVLINTPHSEYVPLISADDSVLIFTSRRMGSTGWNRSEDHDFFEDIYISRKRGNYWVKPKYRQRYKFCLT